MQSIRTAGEIPVEISLAELAEPPLYQRIALEAQRLHRLGLNYLSIGRYLRVSDKTVARALRWRSKAQPPDDGQ